MKKTFLAQFAHHVLSLLKLLCELFYFKPILTRFFESTNLLLVHSGVEW